MPRYIRTSYKNGSTLKRVHPAERDRENEQFELRAKLDYKVGVVSNITVFLATTGSNNWADTISPHVSSQSLRRKLKSLKKDPRLGINNCCLYNYFAMQVVRP